MTVFLDRHSRPETNSLILVENHQTGTVLIDRCIGHANPLKIFSAKVIELHNNCLLPQTLIGASNSKSIGWDINISWALRHKFRISASGKFIILIFLESRTRFKRFSYDVYLRFFRFSEMCRYIYLTNQNVQS